MYTHMVTGGGGGGGAGQNEPIIENRKSVDVTCIDKVRIIDASIKVCPFKKRSAGDLVRFRFGANATLLSQRLSLVYIVL